MISTHLQNSILTITFDRADKKNALTHDMYNQAESALLEAAEDTAVRAVIFNGAGGNFTSGNDVSSFFDATKSDEKPPVLRFLLALARFPKPVVAAVEGLAVGIGTTMLAHCDYVIASGDVKFKMPFSDLALCPEGGSSLLFPSMMGYSQAAELLLLSEVFGSDKAYKVGLLNQVLKAEDVQEAALKVAQKFASKAPSAMRTSKAMIKKPFLEQVCQLMEEEIGQLVALTKEPECKEAISAFMQKRAPDFSQFD